MTGLQRTLTARDPLVALEELCALRAALDEFERERVRRALDSGASYGAIARGLGISRQAAHRRYRDLLNEPPPQRLTASAEALAVLQRARHVAARQGAAAVEGEHVLRALENGPTVTPAGRHNVPLGRRLHASLLRIGAPIGLAELRRAALEDPAVRARPPMSSSNGTSPYLHA